MKHRLLTLFLFLSTTTSVFPAERPVATRIKVKKDGIGRRWLLPGIAYGGLTAAGVSGLVWAYCQHQLSATREELARLNSVPPEALKNMNFYERAMYSYRKLELENSIQSLRKAARTAKKMGIGLTAVGALGFLGKKLDTKFGWFGNSYAERKKLVVEGYEDLLAKTQRLVKQHGSSFLREKGEREFMIPQFSSNFVITQPGDGHCQIHTLHAGLTPAECRAHNLTGDRREQVLQLRQKIVDEVAAQAEREINRSADEIKEATRTYLFAIKNDPAEHPARYQAVLRGFGGRLNMPADQLEADDVEVPVLNALAAENNMFVLNLINDVTLDVPLFEGIINHFAPTDGSRQQRDRASKWRENKNKSAFKARDGMAEYEPTPDDLQTVSLRELNDHAGLTDLYRRTMGRQSNRWFNDLELRVAAQILQKPIFVWSDNLGGLRLVKMYGEQHLDDPAYRTDVRRGIHMLFRGNHYDKLNVADFLRPAQP